MRDAPVVELERITKRFGATTAVDDLSMAIRAGSVHGFIGPNGSGKTTTLRLILGLFRPDSGDARVLGADPGRWTDRIGYLPEERGLYRKMSVRHVLRYYARLKGFHAKRAHVDAWLERLRIDDWADARVESLSKGTAQKVQLAAAVLAKPDLLILDEPFSGADPVSADLLREVVLELRREGATVVLSTHDMNVAEKMCDAIVMLHRGKKVLDGTREDIDREYGERTVKVCIEGELPEMPEVERVIDFGAYQELVLRDSGEQQRVLERLVDQGGLTRFEISRASLHDIFVRLAGE